MPAWKSRVLGASTEIASAHPVISCSESTWPPAEKRKVEICLLQHVEGSSCSGAVVTTASAWTMLTCGRDGGTVTVRPPTLL